MARMEGPHDPQRVVPVSVADIGVRETRLPACGQTEKVAAVESVERIEDKDVFQVVLPRQFDLVDDIGAGLGFALHAVDKILPGGILLKQYEVAVSADVLIGFYDARERNLRRGGEETIGGSPRIEHGILRRGWDGLVTAVAGERGNYKKEEYKGNSFHTTYTADRPEMLHDRI